MEVTWLDKEFGQLLEKAEEYDWTHDIEEEKDDRTYVELFKHSPAGEDFSMVIDFDKSNQAESFLDNLREYEEEYDADEHAEMWIESRGKRGVPDSIRELIEDAEDIKKMITELRLVLTGCNDADYGQVFIYVPAMDEIVRIAEGTGDNLLDEDEENGYKDYIYYDQYSLDTEMTNCDGGQVLLEEMFRDKFKSTFEAIPAVLDMAYGNSELDYVVPRKEE